MGLNLTEGAIQTIMAGGDVNCPIVQILGSKRLLNNGGERHRLLISDGKHINSFAMVASQLNHLVSSGQLPEFTVVKINRYITSMVTSNSDHSEKRVMVILELEVLKKGSEVGMRIGNPVTLDGTRSSQAPSQPQNAPAQPQAVRPAVPSAQRPATGGHGNYVRVASPAPGPSSMIHPISSLNPYQNKWCIKARVTSKPPVRTYKNARGEGKLFSVVFTDESGEIKATGFNNAVEKFYDLLEVGSVYLVSNCTLKAANKQYTQADYELTFHDDSHIVPAKDDLPAATVKYNFVPISKIVETPNNTMIDVIGVAKEVGDVQTLVSRNTGKELKKREVMIVDQTNVSVALTLWDPVATNFQARPGSVIAAKGVSVSEFMGGKSVSTRMDSTIQIDPDIEDSIRLRAWYNNGGASTEVQSISAKSGQGGGSGNWMLMAEVESNNLGKNESSDYFTTAARILMVRPDNCFYRACPNTTCKKKVTDMNNGHYRCEKCNREYDSFIYRLLLNVHVSDCTGSHWVTVFHEEAEKLLKIDGQTFGQMIDSHDERYKDYFSALSFQMFQMKFRCKLETYNDEARRKFQLVNVDPFDPKAYARRLLDNFKNEEGIRRGV